VTVPRDWAVAGPYFEACSCDAICPCRRVGETPGGRSTYGVCDFALGWTIERGHADGFDLAGLEIVMAGSYDDDEPGSPWRVILYIDERATDAQHEALEAIYLGRAFVDVEDHTPGRSRLVVVVGARHHDLEPR